MNLRKLSLTLLLTLTLLLAGCQSSNNAGNTGAANDTGNVAENTAGDTAENTVGDTAENTADDTEDVSGPIAEGDAYRDFTATLTDGSEFTLSDYEGKVILLNFWATWCGPCVGEMPAFEKLQETYGEDLVLVAVNSGEDEETVKSFLEENGYTFPVVLDPEYAVAMLYPIDAIPYTVIIGTDGKVAVTQVGAGDADTMYAHYSELIDGLLEE